MEVEKLNPTDDEIIGTIMSNVIVEHERCGKIILWDFQEEFGVDRLYFNVAALVSDMKHEKIYLQMPFLSYLKLKWRRRNGRKNIRYLNAYIKNSIPEDNRTSLYMIMDFISHYYSIPIQRFDEINDRYYGWV